MCPLRDRDFIENVIVQLLKEHLDIEKIPQIEVDCFRI